MDTIPSTKSGKTYIKPHILINMERFTESVPDVIFLNKGDLVWSYG